MEMPQAFPFERKFPDPLRGVLAEQGEPESITHEKGSSTVPACGKFPGQHRVYLTLFSADRFPDRSITGTRDWSGGGI